MATKHFDVRAARERLGLTTEALAAGLHVTEGEVRAWKAGSLRPPSFARRTVEFWIAHVEWQKRIEECGLPQCEWMHDYFTRLEEDPGFDQTMTLGPEIERHGATCDTCRARREWAAQHLPPPPLPPARGLLRIFRATVTMIDWLPNWSRPAAWARWRARADDA